MNEHHVDLNAPEAVRRRINEMEQAIDPELRKAHTAGTADAVATFVPLPPKPTAGLRIIFSSSRIGLRQLNDQLARASQVGGQRGLIVVMFETPTMASMQPARFVRAEHWAAHRMLTHHELERTLRTYHLDRGYLVLAIVPHDRQPNTAAYTWWFQPYGAEPRS